MPGGEFQPSRLLITGLSRAGSCWVSEIVRQSGAFDYEPHDHPEDRTLFTRDWPLPERYATKLPVGGGGFSAVMLPKLLEAHPDMGVIFLLRHPVDCAMSKIARGQPASLGGDNHSEETAPDGTIDGAVSALEEANEVLHQLAGATTHRQLTLVAFEGLVNTPDLIVECLAAWFGVEATDAMRGAFKTNKNRWQRSRYGDAIDKTQANLRDRHETACGGFFADNREVIAELHERTREVAQCWGYLP